MQVRPSPYVGFTLAGTALIICHCPSTLAFSIAFDGDDGAEGVSLSELEPIQDRFLATERFRAGVDAVPLTPGEWRVLERCWRVSFDRGAELDLRRNCRALLLFAYGTSQPPGLHRENCELWAYMGLPDRSLFLYEILGKFGSAGFMSGFWPPITQRRGGTYFDVGAGSHRAVWETEQMYWPWRPQHLHLFEPVPAYYREARAHWAAKPNATLHNYGLGHESVFVPVRLADTATSTFNELHFSGHRMYLDSVSDRHDAGQSRNRSVVVSIRSVVDVWFELDVKRLSLLHMNCEGCEFNVVRTLVHAGLISRITDIFIAVHLVLDDEEADICDQDTGTCRSEAAWFAIARYCELERLLSRTHRRVFGLPLRNELWTLLPRARRNVGMETGETEF